MPNHVTTHVLVSGPSEDIDLFTKKHFIEEEGQRCFSLDSVIPMPESIKATLGRAAPEAIADGLVGDAELDLYIRALITKRKRHCRLLAHERYPWIPDDVVTWADVIAWLDKTKPSAKKWAKIALLAAAETGHTGWYEWSREHWGTKWDAYSTRDIEHRNDTLVFRFETAWSFPEPVFEKLAEMYPHLTFSVKSHDEGGPAYAGLFGTKKGKVSARYARVPEAPEFLDIVYGERSRWQSEDEKAAVH